MRARGVSSGRGGGERFSETDLVDEDEDDDDEDDEDDVVVDEDDVDDDNCDVNSDVVVEKNEDDNSDVAVDENEDVVDDLLTYDIIIYCVISANDENGSDERKSICCC